MHTNRISSFRFFNYLNTKLPKRYAVVLCHDGTQKVVQSFLALRQAVRITKNYNRVNSKLDGSQPIACVHRMVCRVNESPVEGLLV